MGRAPCCEKIGLRRGRWTAEEDQILSNYIQEHGEGSWRSLPKNAGLLRCGKSCRLRWINYLRSDVKRGNISPEEEDVIIKLQASLGNRWSLIAGHLAGRTDNEIKNYWNSHLSRKISPSSPTTTSKCRRSEVKTKKSSNISAEKQSERGEGGEIEGMVMEPTAEVPMNDNLKSTSSSTNDGSQVVNGEVEWDWEWEWDFEGGDRMLGLGLGLEGEENDDIMSWPWESPTHVVVDVEKQDAMIAWLLS